MYMIMRSTRLFRLVLALAAAEYTQEYEIVYFEVCKLGKSFHIRVLRQKALRFPHFELVRQELWSSLEHLWRLLVLSVV